MDFLGNYADGYYMTKRFSSGVTGRIEFQPEGFSYKSIHYNVWLTLYRKRKHMSDNYLKQTGEDGLAPLLWAKDMIVAFEAFICDLYEDNDDRLYITVTGDDARRRRIYYRYLSKLGFKYQTLFGQKYLIKKVK